MLCKTLALVLLAALQLLAAPLAAAQETGNCKAVDESRGQWYDLTGLTKTSGTNYVVEVSISSSRTNYVYMFNICAQLVGERTATTASGMVKTCDAEWEMCQIDVTNDDVEVKDLGSYVDDIVPTVLASGQLQLKYTNGDYCPYWQVPRTTIIYLSCDPNVFPGQAVFDNEISCTYQFTWITAAACPKTYNSSIPVVTLPACTANDIGHTYLPCDRQTNTRTATYYYNKPCDTTTGVNLPPAVAGLPCSMQCDVGSYLPFANSSCAKCNPGTYSIGGADVYGDWTFLPYDFRSDCEARGSATAQCRPWVPMGNFISNGNTTGMNNMDSHLYLSAQFTRSSGNFIRFTYRVDAQNCGALTACDGLRFFIDNVQVLPANPLQLISTALSWQTASFPVSPGPHEFKWTFHKDYSTSYGEDLAALQTIEVYGTQPFAESCSQCPAGSFNNADGQETCTPCTYNQVTPSPGMTQCQNCNTTTSYAFVGFAQCTPIASCTVRDYYIVNGPCKANNKYDQSALIKDFIPGYIKACNPAMNGSVLPPTVQLDIPCGCPNGLILVDNECVPCEPGSASETGQCLPCQAGYFAPNMIQITDWSALPSIFKTYCTGDCDPNGWLPRGQTVHTGYNFLIQMDSFLTTQQTFTSEQGSIAFAYTLAVSTTRYYYRDVYLRFIVANDTNGQLLAKTITIPFGLVQPAVVRLNETFPIPVIGTYNITWQFHVGDGGGFDRDTYAELAWVTFTGVQAGSSYKCMACQPGLGSAAGASLCSDCPAGTYSTGGTTCIPVADGFFTSVPNSIRPVACGNGTTSNAEHTDCVTDCKFLSYNAALASNDTYDLAPLKTADQTMYYAGIDSQQNVYYLNMCQRGLNNLTCFDKLGNPIPSFACQVVKGWGYSTDIGNVIGFMPFSSAKAGQGLFVYFDNGTPGCKPTYGVERPRRTNITLVCDLNAGVGQPVPLYNTTVEYPKTSCVYYFIWRSAFGCPVCTDDDFTFELQPCENGEKIYLPIKKRDCVGQPSVVPPSQKCYSCRSTGLGVCDSHGTCDEKSGVCNCQSNWSGETCSDCSKDHFGTLCAFSCPGTVGNACSLHGKCSSGQTGTGLCTCNSGWTGSACDMCDDGFTGDNCEPQAAALTDVLPHWAIGAIVVGILVLVAAAILLYRAKRRAEYKYSRLLSSQPIELAEDDAQPIDDDNFGLPDDIERDNQLNTGGKVDSP